MKKQFTKIKIAAENLSRSNKTDRKDFELETIEKQVDKYRDVLDKMVRKLPAVTTSTDTQERDKRIRKNSHYKIGQTLDESSKELSKEMPLYHVLVNCGELEKSIAECIVDNELATETEVVRRLKLILETEIQEISAMKRNVSRTLQEYTSLKRSYEAAIRLDEPQAKINNIKDQQEQCEVKLEKERDMWAAQMFELIAKEDVIVHCIRDYVLNQRNYHERALLKVNSSLAAIQDIIQSTVKSRFGTSLTEYLESTSREISYVLELCICCLVENGLYEEGLLRVGCATTKMRRMKHALEAQCVKTPLPLEYQDPHVIGSILKLYLRELPEPLLTYKYYKDFIRAAERTSEMDRKTDIKAILAKLPAANYANLRYLTKFLWLVTQNVDQNKMSSQNLAIVMSPNMLWPRVDKSNPTDYLGQVNSSSAVNVIVELLISQWDYFFEGEVDFFVTLQRNKLFIEGKSKSNSSNEHLDRNDGDSLESPRYGTLRKQKPYAPSPPKTSEKSQNIVNAATSSASLYIVHGTDVDGKDTASLDGSIHQQKNGEICNNNRAKELFPPSISNTNQTNEKPEKPPLPNIPQFQQLQQQQQQHQQQQQQQQTQDQKHPPTPKPVPMTRTQFFGLDNLPSPVADRKSTDSVSSLGGFKPDLPQKPKIPKRPMVLSLNADHKSDEDKFLEKFRHPSDSNCDNNIGAQTVANNQTQQLLQAEQNANIANITITTTTALVATTTTATATTTTTAATTISNANLNSNCNNANANANTNTTTAAESTNTKTTTTTPETTNTTTTATTKSHQQQRITPTTPISPNMILTPKRPTVPAPPPPTIVKKQVE